MTVSVLQERSSAASGSATTIVLAYSSALTLGSALHVFASCDTGGGVDVSSCVATNNGSFGAALDDINDPSNFQRLAHWVLANVTSATADTITVSFSATVTFRGIWIREIGGCTASPLDGHSGQNQASPGTGTDAISSGNATNNNQPALLSALTLNTGTIASTLSQGTGFTLGATNWNTMYGGNQMLAASESKRITAAGAGIASTFTGTGSARMTTLQAIFDEAAPAIIVASQPNLSPGIVGPC